MKGSPVIGRGEYSPSGTYWRKVAEALKKQVAPKQIKKKAVAILLAMFCVGAQAAMFEWDANSETNLAGYRVYHGPLSRQYLVSTNSTTNTTFTITNLVNGSNFFAVTAFDTDGLESDYSDEVFWVWTNRPAKVQGLRVRALLVQNAPSPIGPWSQGAELTQVETADGSQFYRLAWGEPMPVPMIEKRFLSASSPKSGKLTAPPKRRVIAPPPMPPK